MSISFITVGVFKTIEAIFDEKVGTDVKKVQYINSFPSCFRV